MNSKTKDPKLLPMALSYACELDYDDLPDMGKGKFCEQCQNKVYDFTNMTPDQIGKIWKENNKNICGKMLPGQMIAIPGEEQVSRWAGMRRSILTAIAALGFQWASAQLANSDGIAETDQIVSVADSAVANDTLEDEDLFLEVSGVARIDTARPFQFAHINVEGMDVRSATDKDGKFTLKIPKDSLGSNGVNLLVSSPETTNYFWLSKSELYQEIVLDIVLQPIRIRHTMGKRIPIYERRLDGK